MLISDAYAQWAEGQTLRGPNADHVALSEDWNNFTDMLCKDGELTATQYHHCPAYDDPIPGDADAERDFLLDAQRIGMGIHRVEKRPDGDASCDWPDGARHWRFTLTRGVGPFLTGHFSQGPAHTTQPDLCDVLSSLLMDTSGLDQPFEDWAEDLGYDPDSRKAERIYTACKAALAALESTFTAQELEDLRTMFEDY